MVWQGVIRQYWDFLPIQSEGCIVSLHEGNTPLIPAQKLAKSIHLDGSIFLKCEGFNPTGSFKDRGMTVAVSKALEDGAHRRLLMQPGQV